MLQSVHLQHFRLHQDVLFDFSPQCTLIMGANASGKSSLIEAINLLATGQSLHAEKVEEMITFEQELGRVTGVIGEDDGSDSVVLMLTRGVVQGKRVQKKLVELNGARRSARALRGLLYTTVFRPEDLRLVEGSPSRRRAFLNEVLIQQDPEYARSLSTYERTLIRRNKLLQAVREGEQPRSVLQYWTMSLLKHGQYLQQQRQLFFQFCDQVRFPIRFRAEYQPSVLTQERLSTYADRELAAGHTLIGPHKDDFVILCDVQNLDRGDFDRFHDVAIYGSRGQQRMAVLWLKLCQLEYLAEQTHTRPLLLLDDILSELDTRSRGIVLSIMSQGQSIITTASKGIAERIQKSFSDCSYISL